LIAADVSVQKREEIIFLGFMRGRLLCLLDIVILLYLVISLSLIFFAYSFKNYKQREFDAFRVIIGLDKEFFVFYARPAIKFVPFLRNREDRDRWC